MLRILVLSIAMTVLSASFVFADARFDKMDIDKDAKLTKDEFFKAMPGMKEAAFTKMDLNSDGYIDDPEWHKFIDGHGMDGRKGMMMKKGDKKPMIMPPNTN